MFKISLFVNTEELLLAFAGLFGHFIAKHGFSSVICPLNTLSVKKIAKNPSGTNNYTHWTKKNYIFSLLTANALLKFEIVLALFYYYL